MQLFVIQKENGIVSDLKKRRLQQAFLPVVFPEKLIRKNENVAGHFFRNSFEGIRHQRVGKNQSRLRNVNTFAGIMQHAFAINHPDFEVIAAAIRKNRFIFGSRILLYVALGTAGLKQRRWIVTHVRRCMENLKRTNLRKSNEALIKNPGLLTTRDHWRTVRLPVNDYTAFQLRGTASTGI